MKHYRIGVIAGDGIGPTITAATLRVLDALAEASGQFDLSFEPVDGGAATFLRTGAAMSTRDVERIRSEFDATLKGPVGLPDVRHPDGTEAGVLGGILRTQLDAYANVRPVRSLPGAPSRLTGGPLIDYVIVRENTEGLYASRGRGAGDEERWRDELVITRRATERIVRAAFAIAAARSGAPGDGVSRVTCVDKANVLASYAFFRRVFDEVAKELQHEHPSIETEHLHADAAAAALVEHPEHFDVIVCENFIGDILSDLGAATVGGLGTCPSANLGDAAAYFEPVHGSAPDILAADPSCERANPTAQFLSAALMLDYLGEPSAAETLRRAVHRALEAHPHEGGARPSCSELTDAVIRALELS